jgi:hypothetical protein
VNWVDSIDRCNTSIMEVLDGTTRRMARRADRANADAFAGPSASESTANQASVLEAHCGWLVERGRGAGLWRLPAPGYAGSTKLAACHQLLWSLLRGATHHSSSVKRSVCCGFSNVDSGRSPGGWDARHRPSHANCVATRLPMAVRRAIGATVAQWRAERAAERPKVAKLAHYVRERLSGTVRDVQGRPIRGPDVPLK